MSSFVHLFTVLTFIAVFTIMFLCLSILVFNCVQEGEHHCFCGLKEQITFGYLLFLGSWSGVLDAKLSTLFYTNMETAMVKVNKKLSILKYTSSAKKTTTLNNLTLFPTPSLFAILLAGLYK